MAYEEPHLDSEGAKAVYDALSDMNDKVTGDYSERAEDLIELDLGAKAYDAGDYPAAVEHYRKSAAMGNISAISNLGYCYYYGRSIPVDKEKAKQCWAFAAIFNDIPALYRLGDMLREEDLKNNQEYAYDLHVRAFYYALESRDINVFPSAYLRMFRYYPEELKGMAEYGMDLRALLKDCEAALETRLDRGDLFAEDLLKETRTYLSQLPKEKKDASRAPARKCKITAVRRSDYPDLSEKYENPIEHPCDIAEGQVFITDGSEKPEGLCDSAWETLLPFVQDLIAGGGGFYDGWMKDPTTALLSCNDGFRPVSFYIEVIEEK